MVGTIPPQLGNIATIKIIDLGIYVNKSMIRIAY